MNSKEYLEIHNTYLSIYDEGYKEFPREKVRAKADALKAKADKNEPIANMSNTEIKKQLADKDKMRSRASSLGAASNVGTYSHSSTLASKRNKDRPENKKRSSTVNRFPNRLMSGGSSTLGGVGFRPGSGGRYGLAGVGLADHYDLVLSHLIKNEYADTVKSAEVIMVNMSEEWISHILDQY